MKNPILDLLFPNSCAICGKIQKQFICPYCSYQLRQQEKIKIKSIQNPNLYFDYQIWLFSYEGVIREKILQFKFSEKSYLYHFFVEILLNHQKIVGFLQSYDIIIPVPIDKKRKKKRGYNQSELITNEIAVKLGNLENGNNILQKTREVKPQSTLNRKQRRDNVKNVYKIKESLRIKDKKIILLDDIYTTGSTVNECSKVLKQAGAGSILVFTIAKD